MMKVTAIEHVTRYKVRVSLDGEPAFILKDSEIRDWDLHEGDELSEVQSDELMRFVGREAARTAMDLLIRRDYSEAELYKKLRDKGFNDETAAMGIAYVQSYHYLDDARYVQRYLACCEGKKSRQQAEFDLERKGVSRQLIAECRQKMEEELEESDETELIRSILEKRCKDPKSADEKEIRRHYGYFVRKGFSSSDIWSVFHDFFERFS